MSASDLDLGGGLKLARLLKKGYTGYFEGRTFRILQGGTVVNSFSESQGKIVTELRQKNAMTPTQISDVVGSTPAAVIYNLKPLIRAGVVERRASSWWDGLLCSLLGCGRRPLPHTQGQDSARRL